jgi:hypothetical protein
MYGVGVEAFTDFYEICGKSGALFPEVIAEALVHSYSMLNCKNKHHLDFNPD